MLRTRIDFGGTALEYEPDFYLDAMPVWLFEPREYRETAFCSGHLKSLPVRFDRNRKILSAPGTRIKGHPASSVDRSQRRQFPLPVP